MIVMECPQIKLCARILRWRPPDGFQRLIAFDTDTRGLVVTLSKLGTFAEGLILLGASDADIADAMATLTYRVSMGLHRGIVPEGVVT